MPDTNPMPAARSDQDAGVAAMDVVVVGAGFAGM